MVIVNIVISILILVYLILSIRNEIKIKRMIEEHDNRIKVIDSMLENMLDDRR